MDYKFKIGDYFIPKDIIEQSYIKYVKIVHIDQDICNVEYRSAGSNMIFSGSLIFQYLHKYYKPLIQEPEFLIEELP